MTSATASSPATDDRRAFGVPPEMLERFADLLHDQRAALLGRASRFGVDIEQLQTLTATHGQGETEQTTSEVERAIVEVLEAGTIEALEEIAFALARIDDGSYGICTSCGVPIGTDRLVAMPQTRHCMACQRARERSRR
jgi:DnaK suppressor protein